MNIQILSRLEKLYNVIVQALQDQIGFLNTNVTTLQTSVTTIQNTNLPTKVDKIGILNGDGSYVNALTGDFEYGTINGATTVAYRGIINLGSRLRHYGDTVDPADIVNVQFVNNKIDPVRNLALLAIRRNGDNVSGTNTSQLIYNFSYSTFNFDANSPVNFNGPVTLNQNVTFSATSNATYSGIISSGTNIVNKNYVDNEIAVATAGVYASWYNADYHSSSSLCGAVNPDIFSTNFSSYITAVPGGSYFVAVKAITVCLNISATGTPQPALDGVIHASIQLAIGLGSFNNLVSSENGTYSGNNSAGGDQQEPRCAVSLSAIFKLNPGDRFKVVVSDEFNTLNRGPAVSGTLQSVQLG